MTEKRKMGFAVMDPKVQKEIAKMGGKAAHKKGTAHEFTPDEAKQAGKKGGIASGKARANKMGARGFER